MKEQAVPRVNHLEIAKEVAGWRRRGEAYWNLVSRLGYLPPENGQIFQEPSVDSDFSLPGVIKVAPAVLISAFLLSCARPDQPAEVRPADAVVEVDATIITSTNIIVRKGEKLTFEAKGNWCMGANECGGPDGIRNPTPAESDVQYKQAKIGALIGAVEGGGPDSVFSIGSKAEVTVNADGNLQLAMNDRVRANGYDDNSGSVEVKIFRETGSSPPQVKETPSPVQPTQRPTEIPGTEGWTPFRFSNIPVEMSYPPDSFTADNFNLIRSKEMVGTGFSNQPAVETPMILVQPVNSWVKFEDHISQVRNTRPDPFSFTINYQVLSETPTTLGGLQAVKIVSYEVNPNQYVFEGGYRYNEILTYRTIAFQKNPLRIPGLQDTGLAVWTLVQRINFIRENNNREKYEPVLERMRQSFNFLSAK